MPALEANQRLPYVLLVDDDPLVLRSLARTLQSTGVHVVTVNDPEKALKMIATEDVDCVLCDIRMPKMSGLTFAKHTRAQKPDVPIVLMTGDPGLDSALAAIELGILEYLPKPIDPPKLRETVQHAITLRKFARVREEAANVIRSDFPPNSTDDELRLAFDRAMATMFVAFQPIVDAQHKTTFGFEALLRTREPALPTPPAVVDAAIRLGRAQDLARRVRTKAVEDLRSAPADVLLFLNVLPRDLDDPLLYDPHSPLADMAPRIVLELTERSDLAEVKDSLGRVGRLRQMGYRIAVDDLGAGYAGLSSFAALEPEFTKFDMSLIRGIDTSPVKRRIVGSMVTLCRDLGCRVVAEGVETAAERAVLDELGCDLMQGYLFAKPASPFPDVRW
ncbi:MAG: EAL domain-containing response regulator [Myxococcales bacterium]|nr:EAL domain-containing response regulator [Myxococcales bacterium]